MAITVSGTSIVFNDATTQTTAFTGGGGTVTSVATGNGLTGGTITTSGTLSLDYYTGTATANTSYPIGSYIMSGYGGGGDRNGTTTIFLYTAGITNSNAYFGTAAVGTRQTMSGTWRWRGAVTNGCCGPANGLLQRTA
jgi:hypothetical protein